MQYTGIVSSDMQETQELFVFIAATILACVGGIVRWARHPNNKHTILTFMTSVITAGFVGMQTHFLMNWLDLDLSLQFAISGAAGYGGGILLDAAIPLLIKLVYKKFGLEYHERENIDFSGNAVRDNTSDGDSGSDGNYQDVRGCDSD